jgi:hypothetical protein
VDRGVGRALVFAAVLGAAGVARADEGDLSFGAGVSYAVTHEARLDGRIDLGLTQFVSARALLGVGLRDSAPGDGVDTRPRGLAALGLVYAYDVLTWVPELGAYGGASFGDGFHHARVLALAGVRRYLSRTASIALSAGAEYDWAFDHSRALVDLAFWL